MESEKLDSVIDVAGKLAGRAGDLDEVIVIATLKGGGMTSFDNGVEVRQAVFMSEAFVHWLIAHATRIG